MLKYSSENAAARFIVTHTLLLTDGHLLNRLPPSLCVCLFKRFYYFVAVPRVLGARLRHCHLVTNIVLVLQPALGCIIEVSIGLVLHFLTAALGVPQ